MPIKIYWAKLSINSKMGIKDIAKAEMIKANVPVVPGVKGLFKV